MQTVLITLNSPGADTGPYFNLYSDVDGYVSAFETNVSKISLVSGYLSSYVPTGASYIKLIPTPGSGSLCSTIISIPLTTTTTTTTTTTHPPLVNSASIYNNSPNIISASSYLEILVNGVGCAYPTLAPLASGSSYFFTTSYNAATSNYIWTVKFHAPNSGISSSNYFVFGNGSGPFTSGPFTLSSGIWSASVSTTGITYPGFVIEIR